MGLFEETHDLPVQYELLPPEEWRNQRINRNNASTGCTECHCGKQQHKETYGHSKVLRKLKRHLDSAHSLRDSNKLPRSETETITENVQSSAIWCIPKPTGSCDPQESQDHREWLGRTQRSIPKLLRRIGDCQAQLLQPARDEAGSNGKGLRFLDQGSTSHGSYQRAGADQHLR